MELSCCDISQNIENNCLEQEKVLYLQNKTIIKERVGTIHYKQKRTVGSRRRVFQDPTGRFTSPDVSLHMATVAEVGGAA